MFFMSQQSKIFFPIKRQKAGAKQSKAFNSTHPPRRFKTRWFMNSLKEYLTLEKILATLNCCFLLKLTAAHHVYVDVNELLRKRTKRREKNLKAVGEPPILPVNTDSTVSMSRDANCSLSCFQFQCTSLSVSTSPGMSKDLKVHKAAT